MVFTIAFINDRFDRFNKEIFKEALPRIPVKLSKSKSAIGMYCTKYKSMSDGSRTIVSRHFSFSTCFDFDENKLEDVILHEMIHYLISFNNMTDSSPHGVLFKSVMKKINKSFGRNITISSHTKPGEKVNNKAKEKKWHIIAVLKLIDGKTGIKVLPRYADKSIYYCQAASRSPQVKYVRLFLHNAPFFSSYPTSTVLKFHIVEEDLLRKELIGAQTLIIDGPRLKRGNLFKGEEIL